MAPDVVESGDRPADDDVGEIEVTAEMVEAGVLRLLGFNPEFEHPEDTVLGIWYCMVEAYHTTHHRNISL